MSRTRKKRIPRCPACKGSLTRMHLAHYQCLGCGRGFVDLTEAREAGKLRKGRKT